MIVKIDSLTNKKIKDTYKLKNAKYLAESPYFLVEGYHLFEMANIHNAIECVFTTKIIEDLDEKITQYLVNEAIIDKLSSMKSNQGIITICNKKSSNFVNDDHLVYLENISDPGNLGTILRTSLAFGVKNILISNQSVSTYNHKVLMSSQGAIFDLNIKYIDSKDIADFKKKGYSIISTTLNKNSVFLNDFKKKPQKYILVFGNESRGISEEIINLSDEFIKIDIDNIDSLNVAIAFGITIYSFLKE